MQKISTIDFIHPKGLYNPSLNAYSHIARIHLEQVAEIIHISGQGGETLSDTCSPCFEQQCSQVFFNLHEALIATDLTWHNIANMTILVVEHSQHKHQILIRSMQQYFTQPSFPTCTLIPVPCLALADMQIEIGATAYRFK